MLKQSRNGDRGCLCAQDATAESHDFAAMRARLFQLVV
jgi:hypothetical protein